MLERNCIIRLAAKTRIFQFISNKARVLPGFFFSRGPKNKRTKKKTQKAFGCRSLMTSNTTRHLKPLHILTGFDLTEFNVTYGCNSKVKTLSGKNPKPYNWEELNYFKILTTVMMMTENQTEEEKHPKVFTCCSVWPTGIRTSGTVSGLFEFFYLLF